MKTIAKMAGVCVALGVVLLAGSTASAQYGYVEQVTVAAPAATVVTYGTVAPVAYYSPYVPVFVQPAPVVRVPVLSPPPVRIVAPARVYVPGPAVVRGPLGRVRGVYWP